MQRDAVNLYYECMTVIKQKIFDHAKSKFSPVLKISVSFHFTDILLHIDNIAYLTNSYCLTKAMYLKIYKFF